MPELPEVETIKNGLMELVGTQISQVILRFPRLRYPLNQQQLDQALQQKICSISRRAKYLIFHLETGYLIFHLGMSGRLTLHPNNPTLQKHDHVDILCGHYILRYNDPRRFGCIIYSTSLNDCPMLANLGPEPLTNKFTAEYLHLKIIKRNRPIKQLIMDNAIVVGIGNIYACEALFLTKLSPLRCGINLSLHECSALVANIQSVLSAAIAAGGSSLRDYKNAQGELGYFQQSHKVYARANQACGHCGTLIAEVRLGQRNSFYCPSCQR